VCVTSVLHVHIRGGFCVFMGSCPRAAEHILLYIYVCVCVCVCVYIYIYDLTGVCMCLACLSHTPKTFMEIIHA
jgi:hypothetical protein